MTIFYENDFEDEIEKYRTRKAQPKKTKVRKPGTKGTRFKKNPKPLDKFEKRKRKKRHRI